MQEKDLIKIMAFGDLRAMGIAVPDHLAHRPDYEMLCISKDMAKTWVERILMRWSVPEVEAKEFLRRIEDNTLGHIIATHQLLRVLFKNVQPADFVHETNEAFEGMTPWQGVQRGECDRLLAYLSHWVFNGGW